MTIVLRSTKGSALTYGELDGNFIDLDNRTKVAWQNLRGQVDTTGIVNPPTRASYKGTFLLNQYDPTSLQECVVVFHIPHDYVTGTDIYPHGHVVSATASTGVIRWGFALSYASEYDLNAGGAIPADASYSTPGTSYVEMSMLPAYQDVHLLMSTAAGVTLPGLVPDAVILMRAFRDATHINDTYPDPVFLTNIDLYYQSQGFGTATR